MKRFAVVIVALLSACGCSNKPEGSALVVGNIQPINAQFDIVGKWSDSQGNKVITISTLMTDRQDLRTIARRFVEKKGPTVCVEFFADKTRTPNLDGVKTLDDAMALCNSPDLNSIRIASYRVDPESREQIDVVAQ